MQVIGEFMLYGLEKYKGVIGKVTQDLGSMTDTFNLRLILTEAFTNAFVHGNRQDKTKPILFRYGYEDDYIRLEVKDYGTGMDDVAIPDAVNGGIYWKKKGGACFLFAHMWMN